MHFDPFEVQVVTQEKVTTQQKIVTAALILYFSSGISAIGIALYFMLKTS